MIDIKELLDIECILLEASAYSLYAEVDALAKLILDTIDPSDVPTDYCRSDAYRDAFSTLISEW